MLSAVDMPVCGFTWSGRSSSLGAEMLDRMILRSAFSRMWVHVAFSGDYVVDKPVASAQQ